MLHTVSARVLSVFRFSEIDKTTSRQADRSSVSSEKEAKTERKKNHWIENVAESAESCHCGYQTDCSRPNRIRVGSVGGEGGNRNKKKKFNEKNHAKPDQARSETTCNALIALVVHVFLVFDGPGWLQPPFFPKLPPVLPFQSVPELF